MCFNLAHVRTAQKLNEIKPKSFQKQDQTLTKGAPLATPVLKKNTWVTLLAKTVVSEPSLQSDEKGKINCKEN